MAIVTTDNQHYSDIADAIREKGVSGSFKPSEMAAAIEAIPSGDNLQYANTVKFTPLVSGMPRTLRLYLPSITTLDNIFAYSVRSWENRGTEEIYIDLGSAKPTGMGYFMNTETTITKVTIVGDLSKVTSYNRAFSPRVDGYNMRVETIDANLDFSSVNDASKMVMCDKTGARMKNLRIVPNTIHVSTNWDKWSMLSDETLVYLANGLRATSGLTLRLHATPRSRLESIMGSVSDETFVADDNGSITLENFITQTKGWTVA